MDAALSGIDALLKHRSIRRYAAAPIPAADVERMMRVAQRASSGGLGQLYSFIRVTDAALREGLAEAAGQAHISAAAEFFVACLDVNRVRRLLAGRGQPAQLVLYATTDTLLAVANLAAAAELLGYGVCYVGSLQRVLEQVIQLLQLPQGVCPLVGLCVGVPAEEPPLAPRLPLDIVFHENHYRQPGAADLERCREAMVAATYGGGWIESLSHSFTAGQEYELREQLWCSALVQQSLQAQA